ncbi:hypothetical protein DFH28DRAFT_1156744 [Melampsora americana]|nr:hypothetical protein DFH28DRAFT_890809 [Melampsora americana]KAH9817023.1 hypothetical protein DFH28DRAFT_1156744 [Melampsora americana]
MSPVYYPEAEIPFPSELPVADLEVIDYELLKKGDESEINRMWGAFTGVSFFYLKNTGVDPQPLIDLANTTFAEKLEEKMRFPQGDTRYTFGYKTGFYDGAQIMNVGHDAVDSFLKDQGGRVCLEASDKTLPSVQKFMDGGREVSFVLLDIIERKLELPQGTLVDLHNGKNGSGARITMTPPLKAAASEEEIHSAEHYDFGTFAVLFDNVGGLQFQAPGDSKWQWMKPIAGYASINSGDYLRALTGGAITSLAHRVLPPPGQQAALTRFSPVYFCRPNWGVKPKPVVGISMA